MDFLVILPGLAEPHFRHFGICHALQYLLNHLTYLHKNRDFREGSWTQCPGGTLEEWRQHHPVFQRYNDSCKNTYNFWKCKNNSFLCRSFGNANSDEVSFVIFQHGVCPPYWSKWQQYFCYSSFKTCLDDLWTKPHRNDWTDQLIFPKQPTEGVETDWHALLSHLLWSTKAVVLWVWISCGAT